MDQTYENHSKMHRKTPLWILYNKPNDFDACETLKQRHLWPRGSCKWFSVESTKVLWEANRPVNVTWPYVETVQHLIRLFFFSRFSTSLLNSSSPSIFTNCTGASRKPVSIWTYSSVKSKFFIFNWWTIFRIHVVPKMISNWATWFLVWCLTDWTLSIFPNWVKIQINLLLHCLRIFYQFLVILTSKYHPVAP